MIADGVGGERGDGGGGSDDSEDGSNDRGDGSNDIMLIIGMLFMLMFWKNDFFS